MVLQELLGTKRLFVDWCRTPYGHKLRVDAPPQDTKAPLAEGRTLICRHWVKVHITLPNLCGNV